MHDTNKSFDEAIRSMLENVEEEVPSHILDDVFSSLDNIKPKKKVLPPVFWLRAGMASVAAAAAVALCVVLWPDGHETQAPERYADVQVIEPSETPQEETLLSDVLKESETKPDTKASVQKQNSTVRPQFQTNNNILPEQITGEADEETLLEETSVHQPETADAQESNSDTQIQIANDQRIASHKSSNSNTEEASETGDEWAAYDETDSERSTGVSFLIGGNIASNGSAKGLSNPGGFRAPAGILQDATYIEQTSKNSSYSIPVSLGFTTRLNLGKKWSIGSGLNWTMLQRTFSGNYVNIKNGKITTTDSDIRHTIHYVGIPLNGYYDIIESPRLRFYAYAGGEAEKALANIYRVKKAQGNLSYTEKVKGVQWSVGAGIGVEFLIADQIGIYLNPGVRYYFDCGQPVSIRTQQPLMMNFEIGLRVGI